MELTYIKNENIDRRRYEKSLQKSFNANIFAYAWYLDLVCDDWDLLMEGDYETVCPLPLTKTIGITTIKQPRSIPSLGVFSSQHLPSEKVTRVLSAIPYFNISLVLNPQNRATNVKRKHNFRVSVVDLIPPYAKISERYSQKAHELLRNNEGVFVMRTIRTDEYMGLKRKLHKRHIIHNMQLTRIMNYALRYKSAGIYSVYSPHNELIGAIFLIKSNQRVFLIDWIQSEEGEEKHAVFRAINHVIETNSETNLTLETPLGCSPLKNLISFNYHYCQKYRKGIL
jgi:hypothetical protein